MVPATAKVVRLQTTTPTLLAGPSFTASRALRRRCGVGVQPGAAAGGATLYSRGPRRGARPLEKQAANLRTSPSLWAGWLADWAGRRQSTLQQITRTSPGVCRFKRTRNKQDGAGKPTEDDTTIHTNNRSVRVGGGVPARNEDSGAGRGGGAESLKCLGPGAGPEQGMRWGAVRAVGWVRGERVGSRRAAERNWRYGRGREGKGARLRPRSRL